MEEVRKGAEMILRRGLEKAKTKRLFDELKKEKIQEIKKQVATGLRDAEDGRHAEEDIEAYFQMQRQNLRK